MLWTLFTLIRSGSLDWRIIARAPEQVVLTALAGAAVHGIAFLPSRRGAALPALVIWVVARVIVGALLALVRRPAGGG